VSHSLWDIWIFLVSPTEADLPESVPAEVPAEGRELPTT
jgi:hypothetical protein